ncbi:MAG: orotidine-5'-phosphate decarboxylase [Planctomycetota bacterium]|nr:orotidine-5'-phosphate decarboxylase [Planctomycetota bacterium]
MPARTESNMFIDVLDAAIADIGSPVCVGLDPVLESIPPQVRELSPHAPDALRRFSVGVLEAVAGVVPAVKFQSACYERYGSAGVAVLEECMLLARRLGLVVVLDAKRGDIGISAHHYAASAAAAQAHAITVSGYLGGSGIEPFLGAGLGVFVLVRTSNPDSDAVQSKRLQSGESVAEMMGELVATLGSSHVGLCGLSNVGAVVGATKSNDGSALRERMPQQVFLVPGYGAQGGSASDIRPLLRPDGRGVLVTASRSVIYAAPINHDWRAGIHDAAERMAAEIRAAVA